MSGNQAKRFLIISSGYRIASIFLVVLTAAMYGFSGNLPKISYILLAITTVILTFVYWNLYKNTKIVIGAIRLELLALLSLYTLAGGMGNPIIWYLINPILFDLYFFYSKAKVVVYIVIFVMTSVLGNLYINSRLIISMESASVMLLFILVILLITLLASYQQDLSMNMVTLKYAYSLIKKEIDRNIQTTNWLENSYVMFEKLLTERDLLKGIHMILDYASKAVPCTGVCIHLDKEMYGNENICNKIDDKNYAQVKIKLDSVSQDEHIIFMFLSKGKAEINQFKNQMNILAQITSFYIKNISLMDENDSLIVMKEQKRIAEEIHDGIQQQLMGTVYMLHGIVGEESNMEKDEIIKHVHMIYKELNNAAKGLKSTVYNMADCSYIEDWICRIEEEAISLAKQYKVNVIFDVEGDLTEAIETIYFKSILRVIREGISNGINHGNASEIEIVIYQEKQVIQISLTDNGSGFDVDHEYKYGLGLYNMGQIAEIYNGDFNIVSKLNEGTKVSVSMAIK